MHTHFEFATASRIIFGSGTLAEVGPIAAGLGSRALVVIGSNPIRAAKLLDLLKSAGVTPILLNVVGEPTIDLARRGTALARKERCELVIGLGGGSVLDTGKTIAALLTNGGDPLDYLEVIGQGRALSQPSAPIIAIPTTAGTGAEVTRNAVLGSPEHGVKVSLRSSLMLPRVAIIDPELTYSMPLPVTASTGLDALTQLIEPYLSPAANPLTDALCLDGIHRAARSLRQAYQNGEDGPAREDMALSSLFGGLALANAKLGAVHGFAGTVGGKFEAPHGAVCAALLAPVMAINVQALEARAPGSEALLRYTELAQILTGDPEADVADGVLWVEALAHDLQIVSLGAYGLTEADFPDLIEKASRASSMKGNPIRLTEAELHEILSRAR